MKLTRTNYEIIALLHTFEILKQSQIAHKLNKTHTSIHTSIKRLEALKILAHVTQGRYKHIVLIQKDFAETVYSMLEQERKIIEQWG